MYTSEYQFGLCREWVDQNYSVQQSTQIIDDRVTVDKQCKSCSKHTDCSTCLQTLSCGWCYEVKNPIIGSCISGDFIKPDFGKF